jgi:hypothetical protein
MTNKQSSKEEDYYDNQFVGSQYFLNYSSVPQLLSSMLQRLVLYTFFEDRNGKILDLN